MTGADARTAADGPAAARQLALIGVVQVLALGTWFAASAVAPALRDAWQMGRVGEALLVVGVQLGFVAGSLVSAVTNLPDRVHPPLLMALGSVGAALSTVGVALLASGVGTAIALRLLTGVSLALVYPVGMKLAVSWFVVRRGLAVSVVVGALTLGSISPRLFAGVLGDAWRETLAVSAGLALVAALAGPFLRVGPLVTRSDGFRPGAVLEIARNRAARLANAGYLGHMWELYAVWAWAPVFLAASTAARGEPMSAATVGLVSFLAFGVCGGLGALGNGWLGDRVGRARAATVAMVVSGGCCLAAAAAYGGPPALVVVLLMVWGAAVIADSAMFSACLGSVVDTRYVGTALTLQTALGFLLSVVTIQLVPVVVDAASWRVAVGLLAVGPLLGALAMVRLTPLLPGRA